MRLALATITSLLVACGATTPNAQPHDMSAAGHEAAAGEHDQVADTHAAHYDPKATQDQTHCIKPNRAGEDGVGCWTSTINPTAQHLEDAEKHRKMAADHRAASQVLRTAETQSCVGISDADRDMSPFEHREDIASVEPLTVGSTGGSRNPTGRMMGATVTFRAVPGMTAQWLQRVVECHLARNAALGHVVPEMPSCPLVPNGAKATVTATQNGFAVAVSSDDSATAQEILRRAQLLTSH